jgi:putative hydrolase of the HAD superfamily
MMQTPFELVVFDAVGTLIEPAEPVAVTYAWQARRFGSRLSTDEISARFAAAFREQEQLDTEPNGFVTSESRERARWQAIVGAVFDDVPQGSPEADALFASLWDHYARPQAWRLFPEAAEWIARLDKQPLRWAIASNFDARLHGVVLGIPELLECSRVYVSSELGVRKPAAEFFAKIEQVSGVSPSAILMIGDSRTLDFEPALARGWQALLVGRDHTDGWRRVAEVFGYWFNTERQAFGGREGS